jgi:hypothetical protein
MARLLLDEHYAAEIAEQLTAAGYDVEAIVESSERRSQTDAELFRRAATGGRRIVTENIKDFRPLLVEAYHDGEAVAPLLLISPRRFPRGGGDRTHAIVKAIALWLEQPDVDHRPDEDWLP